MEGFAIIQPTAKNRATSPVSMKRKGRLTDGAVARTCFGWVARTSGAADMGNAASIGLLLGFADESPFFQLGIQQGGTPAGVKFQGRVGGQGRDRLQGFQQRLRRFKTAGVEFDDVRFALHGAFPVAKLSRKPPDGP